MPDVSGGCQWLKLTGETNWGVRGGSAGPYILLQDGAAFNMAKTPNPFNIGITGCSIIAKRLRRHNVRWSVAGSLRTPLFPSQAATLLGWACTPTLVSGRKQLPSYSLDWYDGFETRGFLGVRVASMTLESSDTTDIVMLTLNLVGKTDDTGSGSAPDPETDFPTEIPYTHYHSGGYIRVGGNVLSGYKSINFSLTNVFHMPFTESQYVSRMNLMSREASFSLTPIKQNTNFREAFENVSVQTDCRIIWNNTNLTKSVTLDAHDVNYVDSYSVNRDWNSDQIETLNFSSFYTAAEDTDITLSVV